jgi:hypothetical protein
VTPAAALNGPLLARTAFDILVSDLEGHGNTLSDMHRAALFELVDSLAGYCTGHQQGRKAFPLPTGMGKTSAVVAFVAALHRLGYVVPVSVAASKVEALCAMKRDLLAHGVPVESIGLKHAVPEASEPSTGSESRLVQLVTHARVRSGRDFELFGTHKGQPRALMVYDETLMRADAFAFRARAFFSAVAVLAVEAEGTAGAQLGQLVGYLQDSAARLRGTLAELQEQGDPNSNGAAVELAELDPATIQAYRDLVARHGGVLRGFEADLRDLLALSQDTLRVVSSEQGDGVVTAREAVPAALRNVVVLDASAPIRELARLDPTVEVIESFSAADLKSFEAVEVRQLLSPGGRSTVSYSLRADRQETSAVAREVADIIRDGWDREQAFLVFTFVRRGRLDLVEELTRDLRRAGVDVGAVTPEGKPRVNLLTWGSETSLNGYEHCTAVVMAGVLHRSHLDLAAAVRGQAGHLAEPTPSSRIRELVESEIAHCIYQGASRGSCRRTDQGRARPMRLWFIHRSPGIRALLDRVMPGAVWSYPEPRHLKKAAADSKAAQLLGHLLVHLRTLPETVDKVSSRALKEGMQLVKDKATEHAFTRAVGLLDLDAHGWCLEGRSLVRGAVAHGFSSES